LIDSFLPEYEFRGIRSVTIHAAPARIFRALKEVTLADMPVARLLGELRYFPVRIAGKMKIFIKPGSSFLVGLLLRAIKRRAEA
jgi:hypothetical protein